MVIGAVVLLVIAYLITVILNVSETLLESLVSQQIANLVLLHFLVVITDIALAYIVFLVMYKFVPELKLKWKDIWAGALAAALSFEAITILFILYLDTLNSYNLVYGSIGAIIALLIWTYLSSLVFLFFAKVSAINLRDKTGQL